MWLKPSNIVRKKSHKTIAMKRTRVLKLAVIVVCAIIIGFFSVSRARNVPYERDEISWYFHTEFFDEAFVQKKIFSPLWNGYESFDHPPLSKYIYGAYLYFRNNEYWRERESLEKKYGRWNMYYSIKSDEDISTTEFAPILFELRKVNVVFTLLILVEIFMLFYTFSRSLWFSLLMTAVLSFNTVFIQSTAIITSDSHFLFFTLLALLLYFRSMKSKQWGWIIGASVATALSVGSKLTGVFLFSSVILHEVIRLIYADVPIAKIFKRIGIYVFVSLYVWLIINPVLYTSPIKNTWRYFSFRTFQSANIARYIPDAALRNVSDRAKAIVCTVVIRSCTPHSAPGSISSSNALNVILVVLGLFYCLQAIRKRKSEIIFLIVLGYVICTIYLINLFNYSARYFALLQIIVFAIQILGARFFLLHLGKIFNPDAKNLTKTPPCRRGFGQKFLCKKIVSHRFCTFRCCRPGICLSWPVYRFSW